MVWAAHCGNCGRVSGVRKSFTGTTGIEFPHPNRKTVVECPHCKHRNEFSDGDLIEIDANILGETEESGETTSSHPDTPSDKQ